MIRDMHGKDVYKRQAEDKARMMTLVENLRTALGQHIDQLDWMSDSTKMRAREKLAAFHAVSYTHLVIWVKSSLMRISLLSLSTLNML